MIREETPSRRAVILLTGMSGSGKSCCLKTLEDMGYETIDNLPLALLLDAVKLEASARPLAIGVDIRTRGFIGQDFLEKVRSLRSLQGFSVELIFLDCDAEVLQKRYRETRRHHPLSPSENTLADVIAKEKQLLQGVKASTDHIIDTSLLATPELRLYLQKRFSVAPHKTFQVTFLSFAFPEGVPREADLVFDMRFLKNPYYVEDLRPLTGKDVSIRHYLEAEKDFQHFQQQLQQILEVVLSRFKIEGRDYVTVAFGCTGGRHRSVFTAEAFGAWSAQEGYITYIQHRDLQAEVSV